MSTLKYVFYILVFTIFALSPVFSVMSLVYFLNILLEIANVGRNDYTVFRLFPSAMLFSVFALMAHMCYSQFFTKTSIPDSHQ